MYALIRMDLILLRWSSRNDEPEVDIMLAGS